MPPDAIAKTFRMRFDPQQARRVRKHRSGIRLRKALAAQHLIENLRVTARQIGMRLAFARRVPEVPPSVHHLFARAPADAELQPPACNQIRCARVFRHIERILITHVDDARADFDPAGLCTDGRKQWKRRRKLLRKMMDAEERAIGAECLGSDREVDGLKQHIGRRACP
jgi:hypothetical protein